MKTIDPEIFKKYDVRGRASGANAVINKDVAYLLGQGMGTFLLRLQQITAAVVGRDNRETSFALQVALMEGLQRAGVDVIDIGLVSTPLVYWHAVHAGEVGGIMVTGSHLTPEYNGFKMSIGGKPIFGYAIEQIKILIEDQNLAFGKGDHEQFTSAYSEYVHDLRERIYVPKKFKVVFDPGNGTAGLFVPRLVRFWKQDATGINVEPNAHFPNHLPNPQEAANMQQLGEKVREVGADIGFAYDGDADRIGVVDENGQMIAADRILALLAQDMLKRKPGASVVVDVLSSQALFDAVAAAGGRAILAPSGHSLVKEAMSEYEALLGGEMSGHLFFAEDYFGFDDAFFATGRILQMLSNAGKPLSQLNAALPHYYSTPEYRPHCPDSDKQMVIDTVAKELVGQGKLVNVDGIRVQFDKGWGILRASNTEPVLSLRFEGQTEADALHYRDLFAKAIAQFPQVEQFV